MNRRFSCCCWVLTCLATASAAWAWSSKDFPPCEPIHQIAIENVLSNQVAPSLIKILQDQQTVVDKDQQALQSFEHSMTGIDKAGEQVTNQRPIFIIETEAFIRTNLVQAIQARKAGDTHNAYVFLGKAMHPLEDATSPSHKPFQVWAYNESLWAEIVHVFHERSYPDSQSDTNQVEERAELEGAVQYAYDLFMEKTGLPAQFYNHTNALLILPPAYLHPRSQ